MDKFRIRGGDFIGIVIPGTILFFNLYLLYQGHLKHPQQMLIGDKPLPISENVILFLIFTVITYTFGIVLRFLSPNLPDILSTKIRILINKISRNKRPHYGLNDKFPYFHWFLEQGRYSTPDIVDVFNEYADMASTKNKIAEIYHKDIITVKKEKEKGDKKSYNPRVSIDHKSFLNYCKLYIMHNSSALGEEVLFAEGFSRMISGIFYAAFVSVIVIVIEILLPQVSPLYNLKLLLLANCALFAMMAWGIHQLRVKEVTIIFSSYGILMNCKNNEKKKDSSKI